MKIKIFLALAVCASLAGCDKSFPVSGQVFVVTQGRENIKLALVQLSAYPEKEFHEYLAAKKTKIAEQRKELSTQLAEAKSAVEAQQKKIDATTIRYLTFFAPGTDPSTRTQKFMKAKDAGEKQDELDKKELARAQKTLADLSERSAFVSGPGLYFEEMPASTISTKSDADGRFTLIFPSGKYVIAAKATRNVLKGAEVYFWLVRFDSSAPTQPLMISNDNLVETKCKECVMLPQD